MCLSLGTAKKGDLGRLAKAPPQGDKSRLVPRAHCKKVKKIQTWRQTWAKDGLGDLVKGWRERLPLWDFLNFTLILLITLLWHPNER